MNNLTIANLIHIITPASGVAIGALITWYTQRKQIAALTGKTGSEAKKLDVEAKRIEIETEKAATETIVAKLGFLREHVDFLTNENATVRQEVEFWKKKAHEAEGVNEELRLSKKRVEDDCAKEIEKLKLRCNTLEQTIAEIITKNK